MVSLLDKHRTFLAAQQPWMGYNHPKDKTTGFSPYEVARIAASKTIKQGANS